MTFDPSPLFRPLTLGPLQLENRVVMAPMTRSKSPDGVPGPDVAAYYARRAQGGAGLIITEGTCVEHPAASGYPDVPAFYGAAPLAGWREVVQAVHSAGAKIFPQLWHVGSVRRPGTPPNLSVPGYSPSGLVKAGGRVVGHVMSEVDIADVISAFGKAAGTAQTLGFDGVELHGAHGYLLDQFFWAGLNQRADRYGGSLEARTRFGVELVREVRKQVGPGYPLCLRFSQWKLQDYGARLAESPEELARFLVPFVDAGIDIFHCSTRRFSAPEFAGSPLNLAGWTKKLTGKAVIIVGGVGLDTEFTSEGKVDMNDGHVSSVSDLSNLLERLDSGEFDLVAVGRALIADAEWADKVRVGRLSEIRSFRKQQLAELV